MAHDSSRLTGTTTPLHTPLRKGSVRLLRLLPNSNQNSPIECQLITFSMLDTGSTHPYECLSYVWGSNSNKQPIYVDGCKLHVTANLHAALSHLRHCFLERILWVDAICINQDDNDEKGQQVQLMAKIYAKASRVVVWLGEAADSSDYALEAIRAAADEQLTNFPIDEENRDTILTLLERGWFERIWVLQEVAAARHILIKCGPVEMDGYVFCSGLSALNISYETRPHLLGLIPPILYLIRGAVFRPRSEGNETSRQDRFSLNIRPLGQLVDMYHTHKATIRHDKVYALLGMSNDEPSAAGLEANYEDPWREAFRKLVHFCLSDRISVCTWDSMEAAVIEGKGYILGEVSSAGQDVNIAWKDAPSYFERREQSSCFTLQASAKAAKRGDIVCLLQGALRPTIIRPCDEFSTVVMIAVPLIDNDLKRWSASVTTFPVDLLMVWNWNESQRELQGGEDYGKLISSRGVPECPIADCQCPYGLDKAIRLWNFGLFLNRMERYGGAITNFQRAVEVYGSTVALGSVDRKYLGHGSRKRADEEALRIMDDLYIDDKVANIRRKYEEYSQNPLSWAAENGQEAIVRMMIGNGANIEAKGQNSWAPLMRAARNGHEAVVRLLIEKGASVDLKDRDDQTPLSWAVKNGHKAVVQLLIEKGASMDCVEEWYRQTPLSWAAKNGYEAVVQLLIEKGVSMDLKDAYRQTPLSWAARNGHEAVVRLLIEKGASMGLKDKGARTPLLWAAKNGNEGVVRLLIEKGANTDLKDWCGQTPLSYAAENGHEAVVRLLIEKGR